MMRASRDWRAVLGPLARWMSPRNWWPKSIPHKEPRILGLVPEGPNRLALETFSSAAGWPLTFSSAESHGRHSKQTGDPPLIIYDCELSPQHWREVVRTLASQSPRPYIILLSPHVDGATWEDLQRSGGSDILCTPIARERLIEALAKGRQLWSAQQRLRALDSASTR